MKKMFILLSACLFMAACAFGDEFTVADVVEAQDAAAGEITSMAASVSAVTEYNGASQVLEYDYAMKTDGNGDSKVMVTTKGVFAMQFLVDTSDMSVTYLMGDGTQRKVTASAEVESQIKQMAGIGGLRGPWNHGNLYAALGMRKSEMSDAVYENKLKTKKYETDDMVINVKGSRGNGKGFLGIGSGADKAEVEYINKNTGADMAKWDKAMEIIQDAKPANESKAELKKESIAWMKENRDKARKSIMAKRVEKINMQTGMVEEQETYNPDGERTGYMKVTGKRSIQTGGKAMEIPVEMQTEMTGAEGYSRTKTNITNIHVNEYVKFEWVKKNDKRGGK